MEMRVKTMLLDTRDYNKHIHFNTFSSVKIVRDVIVVFIILESPKC